MKRKIAFISILALLLVCLTSVISYADSAEDDRAGLLSALGIVDEMMLRRDTVTRGEFTLLVAKALNTGLDESVIATENPFADLYKYEEGAEMYLYLKKLGIIKGDGENKFNKKDLITVEQAYTIALRAMGYEYELEGDPDVRQPLLMLANRADINIGKVISENLTAKDAVYMIYKMLHSDNFTLPGYLKYEITIENETFIEYYWHIRETEGIVKANDVTHISSADKYVSRGKVLIDNTLYDDINSYASGLLGLNVKAYINNDDEIVYANSHKNNKFSLTSDAEPKYKDFTVKYINLSDNEASVKLDNSFLIIYNGIAADKTEYINITDGSVDFIDNNNDNVYDIVFVDENKYIFVESVNTREFVLIDKNDKNFKLNCEDNGEKNIIFYDDKEQIFDFASLATDMLVRVNTDEKQKYIRGYVSLNTIYGTISYTTDEDIISIDGVDYDLNSYYSKFYGDISVGATGTFYLDDLGRIAAFIPADEGSVMKYGYVMGAKRGTGINNGIKVMVMTESGDSATYNIGESCIVDGYKLKDGDSKLDSLFINESGNTKYQLIRYAVDANGVFTMIDTTASNNDYATYANPTDVNDSLKSDIDRGGRKYKSVAKLFLPYSTTEAFRIDDNTKIFVVPNTIGTTTEATSYSSSEFDSGVSFKNDTPYQIEGYNIDKSGLVKAVVVYQTVNPTVGGSSQYGVVYKTRTVLDEEGNTTTRIDYYDGTGFKELLLSEEEHLANKTFNPGDFIRFETNQRGIATVVQVDYSHVRGSDFSPSGEDGSFEIRKMSPYYIKDGYMIAKTAQKQYVYNIGNCTKIEYVESTENILPSSIDAIKCVPDYTAEASEVFLVLNYSSPKLMIIYNK